MSYLDSKKAMMIEDGDQFKKGEVVIISGNPFFMRVSKDSISMVYAVNAKGVIELVPLKKIRMIVKTSE